MHNCRSGLRPVEAAANDQKPLTTFSKDNAAVIKSQDDWELNCGPSTRGLCAVGLFRNSDFNASVDILVDSVMALSSAESVAAYRFVTVVGDCQVAFTESFGLSTSLLPTVIAYSPSKSRYASFKGAFVAVSSSYSSLRCDVS